MNAFYLDLAVYSVTTLMIGEVSGPLDFVVETFTDRDETNVSKSTLELISRHSDRLTKSKCITRIIKITAFTLLPGLWLVMDDPLFARIDFQNFRLVATIISVLELNLKTVTTTALIVILATILQVVIHLLS